MESATAKGTLAAAGTGEGADALLAAVEDAAAGVGGNPSLVLAFPTAAGPNRSSMATELGGYPLAGISGSGAIGAGGGIEHGCAALAFSEQVDAAQGICRDASADLRAAARAATAEALERLGGAAALVLLFLDTVSGDQAEAIAGAYEAAGPGVPLAGGAAGSAEPFLIGAGEILTDAVVAIALRPPGPVSVGVMHGCRPVGPPSIATRSEGRRLLELDGRPAVEVYLENMGFGDLKLDDTQFEALAVTHPLAQPELNGIDRVRHVLRREGDALVCATHIPANAAVQCTHETPEEIVATAALAVERATADLEAPPRAALLFDCAGRKRAVASSLSHEISALLGAFAEPVPPLAGLFTHGEVARVRGAKGDRNHAIVVVTFG